MYLALTTRPNRKYPAWLVRARMGDTWYEVTNVLHPGFWADWWVMWEGKRLWALRFHLRHIVRRLDEPSIYITEYN